MLGAGGPGLCRGVSREEEQSGFHGASSTPWETQQDLVPGPIFPSAQAPRALSQLPLGLADAGTPEYHLQGPTL